MSGATESTSIPFHLQSIHIVAVFNQTLLMCVHNNVRKIILPQKETSSADQNRIK